MGPFWSFLYLLLSGSPWNFAFTVKFYPPDPAQLTEDITRWGLRREGAGVLAAGDMEWYVIEVANLGAYWGQADDINKGGWLSVRESDADTVVDGNWFLTSEGRCYRDQWGPMWIQEDRYHLKQFSLGNHGHMGIGPDCWSGARVLKVKKP